MKKIQVKILIENLRTQYKKHIKEIIDVYIKRIIKDLNEKTFKHYIYIKHYDIALDFTQNLRPEKASNIIFNKKL